jgi:hypothetical protein
LANAEVGGRGKRLDLTDDALLGARPAQMLSSDLGGPVVKSGDPVEQEKQLKYASLVANAVMLSSIADLTDVLSAVAKDGQPVTATLVASTSPYIREHIRRFGRFALDMEDLPNPLNPQPLPFEVAL